MGCNMSSPSTTTTKPIKKNSLMKMSGGNSASSSGTGILDDHEVNIIQAYDTGHQTLEEIHERIEQGTAKYSMALQETSDVLDLTIGWVSQRGFYPDDLDKENQDTFLIECGFHGEKNTAYFGVFDGHGKNGDLCSRFARDVIGDVMADHEMYKSNFRTAFDESFIITNEIMHKQRSAEKPFDDSMSGTTAITVFFRNETIFVGNVGDSRAIVCGVDVNAKNTVHALSLDQTPFRKDERERCKACGARVMTMDQMDGFKDPNDDNWGTEEDDEGDPPRLWLPNKRYPGTAFTRSIGDAVAESIGVTAEPETLVKRLSKQDKYIVIASDGVFEFLTNENVMEIVFNLKEPELIARSIVAESYRLWLQYEVRTDDITCIVIKLDGLHMDSNDFNSTVASSFMEKIESSGIKISLSEAARPVRRTVTKSKRAEINSGDLQKLTNEELNFVPPTNFKGTHEEKVRIETAVKANFLFQHLSQKQREGIFNSMEKVIVKKDDVIIKQGDIGDKFYIIDDGSFDVIVTPKSISNELSQPIIVHTYSVKGNNFASFGELALMYGKPRAATVRAKTDGVLWALDRIAFRAMVMKSKSGDLIKTLAKVSVLKTLEKNQLLRLADILTEVHYKEGEYIIKQGDIGNTFFVVNEGEVKVTKTTDNGSGEEFIMKLGINSYFGERALLSGDKRAANVVAASARVDCYSIGRNEFEEVLGPLQLLIDADRIKRENFADNKAKMIKRGLTEGLSENMKPTSFDSKGTVLDIDIGHINIAISKEKSGVYSVFCFDKNVAFAEKKTSQVMDNLHRILNLSCKSLYLPFSLLTMQDECSLYLVDKNVFVCSIHELIEAKMTENNARHLIACIILALEVACSHNIHYRGLSSERILISDKGIPILSDFRLSKDNLGRSFTICGVPEYMPPELISGKGADYTSDFWSLGVLTHELVTGKLPFETTDKISEIQMFEHISSYKQNSLNTDTIGGNAASFIHSLIDPNVETRLGSGGVKKGFESIKKHAFFKEINWEKLSEGSIVSPFEAKAKNFRTEIINGDREVAPSPAPFMLPDKDWYTEW